MNRVARARLPSAAAFRPVTGSGAAITESAVADNGMYGVFTLNYDTDNVSGMVDIMLV